MLTSISLKIAALASVVLLASGSCNLCKANHEAGNRKTHLLIKPEHRKINFTQSPQRSNARSVAPLLRSDRREKY
jgi:hypothetical protein